MRNPENHNAISILCLALILRCPPLPFACRAFSPAGPPAGSGSGPQPASQRAPTCDPPVDFRRGRTLPLASGAPRILVPSLGVSSRDPHHPNASLVAYATRYVRFRARPASRRAFVPAAEKHTTVRGPGPGPVVVAVRAPPAWVAQRPGKRSTERLLFNPRAPWRRQAEVWR